MIAHFQIFKLLIGLLSDTHSYLDPTVAGHVARCDEIWHAGDIGEIAVIDALEKIKPVQAVYGNIDDGAMRARLPEDLWLTREGVTFFITHIAGRPPQYNPRIKKVLKHRTPDVLICGHSHICQVSKDTSRNLLYINPGAAGQQGFHAMRTMIRMEVQAGRISKMEVIELGKRGQLAAITE